MPVTNVRSLGGLNKLKAFHSLKQREVFCPVSKLSVMTTPLTVGDDLILRTMIASPEFYDREIARLIYNHLRFPSFDRQPSFDEFVNIFSSFDRKILIYSIYSSTYNKVVENQTITCPNCKFEFKDTIKSTEIVDNDIYKIWDKESPFEEYVYEISIDIEPDSENTINSLVFGTRVPSIKDHFNVLQLVSPDKIKENYDKTQQILSKSEELTLVTKYIKVLSNVAGTPEEDVINELFDISSAISNYIIPDIVNDIIDDYNTEFSAYSPDFKKNYTCSNCSHDFSVPVNIELSLFRSFFRF